MRVLNRSRALLSLVAAVAVLTVAGCTSDSDDAVTSSSSTSSVSASSESSARESSSAAETTVSESASSESAAPATTEASESVVAPPVETSEPAPAPTTEVAAPGGGDINQTVPAVEQPTAAPVALTETAQFGSGVAVNLTSLTKITTVAQGPGEVSGPGLAVTIAFTNNSSSPVSLDGVNVTLDDGNANPASPMSGDPAVPFTGDLAPGASATGVYVFSFPDDYKDPSRIQVSYSADAPILEFLGSLG